MGEPRTLKDRMKAKGWSFDCDYDQDGVALIPIAMKLSPPTNDRARWVTHYHTDAQYETDLAECRAAWNRDWDSEGTAPGGEG